MASLFSNFLGFGGSGLLFLPSTIVAFGFSTTSLEDAGASKSSLGLVSGLLGFGETISVLALLTTGGGGVSSPTVVLTSGLGLGFGLGFVFCAGSRRGLIFSTPKSLSSSSS
jgi:hypothetical protein